MENLDLKAWKARLRFETSDRIRGMDPTDRQTQQDRLVELFSNLPGLATAATVLLYVSFFPEEVDTGPLHRQILRSGRRLILPVVQKRHQPLRLREVTDLDSELVPGKLSIPEPRSDCRTVSPTEIDWVLVPGLAFDGRCHRLGRGAGHYDRLLPTLRPEAPRWGLILTPQWFSGDLPTETHDQPLDGVADCERIVLADREDLVN